MARLDSKFFLRDTVAAAQDLLGRYLIRRDGEETIVCRITETEAYVGAIDKACHAYGGRHTPRTETLYAAPGTTYVYLIYGMHHCLNFVTEPEGTASAVLIRGAVPVQGLEAMAKPLWPAPVGADGLPAEELLQRSRQALPGHGGHQGGERPAPGQ